MMTAMIRIYVTFTNTSVAVCEQHRMLAQEKGWSFLEEQPRRDEWPCYFSEFHQLTFWHSANGQIYTSRSMTPALQEMATTMARYRTIVRRAYGNLRGITFGTEKGQAA